MYLLGGHYIQECRPSSICSSSSSLPFSLLPFLSLALPPSPSASLSLCLPLPHSLPHSSFLSLSLPSSPFFSLSFTVPPALPPPLPHSSSPSLFLSLTLPLPLPHSPSLSQGTREELSSCEADLLSLNDTPHPLKISPLSLEQQQQGKSTLP